MICRAKFAGSLMLLCLVALAAGCGAKKSVRLDLEREVVAEPPGIDSVTLQPSGTLDTYDRSFTVRVELAGDPDLTATFDVNGRLSGQPMEEVSPGRYRGSFHVLPGESGDRQVKARLTHGPTGAERTMAAAPIRLRPVQPILCPDELAREFDRTLSGVEVYFALNELSLSEEARAELTNHQATLTAQKYAHCPMYILGHSDEQGSPEYNLDLSRRRAFEVRFYLTELGVEDERMVTEFFGEAKPANAQKTADAYAKNRRVEVRGVSTNGGTR